LASAPTGTAVVVAVRSVTTRETTASFVRTSATGWVAMAKQRKLFLRAEDAFVYQAFC
jgi:hypothetical protein